MVVCARQEHLGRMAHLIEVTKKYTILISIYSKVSYENFQEYENSYVFTTDHIRDFVMAKNSKIQVNL